MTPAEAIAKELEKKGCKIDVTDPTVNIDISGDYLKKIWKFALKYPMIQNLFYRIDTPLMLKPINKIFGKTKKWIDENLNNYDFVISTHHIPTQLIAELKEEGKAKIPFFAYNSDVLDAHYLWVTPLVDKYFTPSKSSYELMLKKGIPNEKLIRTGFIINSVFTKKIKTNLKKEMGLKDGLVFTFALGGEGLEDAERYIKSLLKKYPYANMIVICGRNEKLKSNLERLEKNHMNLRVKGFVNNIHEYYVISDIVVGKSGLNTILETTYLEKPFLVIKAMANEVSGAKYIVDNNFGWWVKSKKEFMKTIDSIIANPDVLTKLKRNLKIKKYKPGTEELAKHVVDYIKNKKRMKKERGAIFYCDSGSGFRSSALSIKKMLDEAGYDIEIVDGPKVLSNQFIRILLEQGWNLCLKYPPVFNAVYTALDNRSVHILTSLLCIPLKKRLYKYCLLYTSPSPRDRTRSRMPSSA